MIDHSAGARSEASSSDADARKRRVLAELSATPSPTRSEGRRRGAILLVASVALGLLAFQLAGGLAHSATRPLALTVEIAAGWALFCAGLSWLVLWRGVSTLGRPPRVLLTAALVTPVALLAWMHDFHGRYVEPAARIGWRCLGLSLLIGSLPLGSLLSLRRGVEPRNPAALGAAIGAMCGAWAGLLTNLWCPQTTLLHVLFGHVLPIVLLLALGTVIGRRTLGVH